MKASAGFVCFSVLAVMLILLKISGVVLGGVHTLILLFVTYVASSVLSEIKKCKKNRNQTWVCESAK